MESIWKAAQKDDDCEAYVIPIKYIEFDDKREVKAIKYEGDLFPEYVKVTNYNQYNFEERKPDAIYFHNPYDENNYVTSVDPKFYSSELKKFTDKLVFVPYFVSNSDSLNEGCATSPGVLNANRVIAESEKIKRQYCDLWAEIFEKNTNYNKEDVERFLDKKFLALGSPKIDKALESKENFNIPEDWKAKIGKRKVVFYNTHLYGLILYKEEVIEKFKSVFELFKDNREFVLVWRPHPLSKQTIASMNPELLNEYEELEKWYIENNIGILDESSDLHRALSISDAYFGDGSSLTILEGVNGKPMMYQSTKVFDKDLDRYNFDFESWFIDKENNTAWMSGLYVNGLFKMDLKSGKIDYVGQFPWYKKDTTSLYSKVYKYDNKIICLPNTAEGIAIYDITKSEFFKIDIDSSKCEENSFISIAAYKNYVFLIGRSKPVILRINMDTYEVMYINDLIKISKKSIIDSFSPCFEKDLCVIQDNFYIPFSNSGLLLNFNMKELNYVLYDLGKDRTFNSICFDGKSNLWIAPRKAGAIVRFNIETEAIEEYTDYPVDFDSCDITFSGIEYSDGFIYLIPSKSNMLLKLNENDGSMKCIKYFDKVGKLNAWQRYYFSYVENNLVKLFDIENHKIVHFDDKNNEIIDYDIKITEDVIAQVKKEESSLLVDGNFENYIKRESNLYSIEEFLMYVKDYPKEDMEREKKVNRSIFSNSDGSSGEKIHKYIKSELK